MADDIINPDSPIDQGTTVSDELTNTEAALNEQQTDYVKAAIEIFIASYITRLIAARAARILKTTRSELPIIGKVQKDAGLKPESVSIASVKDWSKEDIAAYRRDLLEYGGTYIVQNGILAFKPWMNDLKADLIQQSEKVIAKAIEQGYQPEELREALIKAMGNEYNNRLYVSAYVEARTSEDKTKRMLYHSTNIQYVIWHTRKDARVRDTHRSREGEIFALDDCPSLGEPGCRCWIYPYVKKGSLMIPLIEKGGLTT